MGQQGHQRHRVSRKAMLIPIPMAVQITHSFRSQCPFLQTCRNCILHCSSMAHSASILNISENVIHSLVISLFFGNFEYF